MGTSQNANTEGATSESGAVRSVSIVYLCPNSQQSKLDYSPPEYIEHECSTHRI